MVKNTFISVSPQEEKEENKGSVEFQVFNFSSMPSNLCQVRNEVS
uniref:Ribosomal protein S15 n=1 Tax=Orontium aquaticum TaxID=78384 RepID=A0A6M3HRI9_OROAQ|nr:ribosomal protein S15 [Orontium aquaticum]QIU82942.1 ribosomal protein S15 [Orontium aquaticum]